MSARRGRPKRGQAARPSAGGPCARLSQCGSCPLLTLPYHAQLERKQEALLGYVQPLIDQLEGCATLQLMEPVASPQPLHYRHSVKLVTQSGALGPQVGLYQPGTHVVVDTQGCPVQSTRVNELLDALRAALKRSGAPELYDEQAKRGSLRYVVVREAAQGEGSGDLHLTLVARADTAQIRRLGEQLSAHTPAVRGVSLHVNASDGNAIFDWSSEPLIRLIAGTGTLTSVFSLLPRAAPLSLQASVESFSQVNPRAAALAYRAVVEGLAPSTHERALDLYCGVGSITLALAQSGCVEVIGLEESPSSIRDARANATLNDLKARFVEGLTEVTLPAEVQRLTEALPLEGPAGSVLPWRPIVVSLNPSRRGCQPQVIEALARLKPRRLAYMSCHPRTLTRDLKRFIALGYQPRSLQLFDLFPGTPHFEVVCVIEPVTTLLNQP